MQRKKGEVACNDFVPNRLKSNDAPFHERIKKCKLKTFKDLNVKKVCKLKEGTVSVAGERSMFARLLVIPRKRGVSMKEIMKYSLGPIPWSMALADGSLVKPVKSKLLNVVEKDEDFEMDCLPDKVLIYDGMVLLQQLGSVPIETFGDVSDHLLNRMLKYSADFAYLVTDRYIPNTIKSIERSKRSSAGTIRHVRINSATVLGQ